MPSVAFLGSHPLGEACLARLHDHTAFDVRTVVTYPADYDGWWDGSVHALADELGYPVLTTEQQARIRETPVDYLISVYYPNILGSELLDHPTATALNLHQAELPRYRGSNVFSHSILNAREDDYWRHGTTLHVMAEQVDAGDIVDRRLVDITESDTARSLYEKTRDASIELFENALPVIAAGDIEKHATPQSEFDGPRYFYAKDSLDGRKAVPPDRLVNAPTETYDLVRALDFPPHEPAYTTLDGERVYLTKQSYEGYRNR